MRRICFILIPVFLVNSAAHAQQDSTKDIRILPVEGAILPSPEPVVQPVFTQAAASSNPNISVIGDFRTNYKSDATRHYDANLHETEFSFQSTVDPYARADFFYSVSRNPATGEFNGEIEEGYLTTIALPAHLQLKVGKFRSALGRINPVHPHALPFIDVPNAYRNYFGEDGINDEGISASWLIPNHAFYQELNVELTDGPRDNPTFHRSQVDNFLKLVHLKNFWDLDDNNTLEFGISAVSGENDSLLNTNILAGDLTFKWKPLRLNTYHSLTWQNEFYYCNAESNESRTVKSTGFYTMLNYQIGKRWFLCGRYDYSNLPFNDAYKQQAYSATLGWYATEFQKIELEGKTTSSAIDARNYEAMIRWIWVIGSHGAHLY